jgi:hypothetical protein
MPGRRFRWLTVELVASGVAGLSALTAMMNSAFAYGAPDVSPPLPPPIPATTEVMGGSGNPIPGSPGSPADYLPGMNANFIQPNLPGTTPAVLVTPEELYPLTGVKSLPLDQSVSEGVTILNNTIQPELDAGTPVGVFGYSQSTIIASQEMQQLDPAGTPSDLPAQFVLAADLNNPNGGLLERFGGLQFPALGLTFSGATPADDFPTTVYTGEYDGFADFPRYPLDFLADLNAVLGIILVHPNYDAQPPSEVQPIADGGMAVQLPTQGDTETTYYMIPTAALDPTLVTSGGATYFTENLPLLEPLRLFGGFGNALADLLQPDLTALVNLGYGDPDYGWSTAPANVPTPFGLFPSLADFEQLPGLLESGTQQGIQAFMADLSHPSTSSPSPSDLLTDPFATLPAATPITSLTDFVNALSSALSTAYATLLPTADIANTLTSLPTYDLSLFTDNLSNPLDALGLPIAANTGLDTLAGGVELLVILDAVDTIAKDFGGL